MSWDITNLVTEEPPDIDACEANALYQDHSLVCPDCGESEIERRTLNFKPGETLTFTSGGTAKCVVAYRAPDDLVPPKPNSAALTLSEVSVVLDQSYFNTEIIGDESHARACISSIVENDRNEPDGTFFWDWNRPVPVGLVNDEGEFERRLEWHEFDFSDNPLNDDWRLLNCFAGVYGDLFMWSYINFAVCAAWHPWDRYVTRLMTYEPTQDEEEWLRKTQLAIDFFQDEASSSSNYYGQDFTYSRHKDYPTKLDEGGAVLNTAKYTGFTGKITVYSNLSYNADEIELAVEYEEVFETANSADSLYTDYLGNSALQLIKNGEVYYVRIRYSTSGRILNWEITDNPQATAFGERRGWLSNLPMDPETYLPDLDACTAFACNILDQAVDWSSMEFPIATTSRQSIYTEAEYAAL
jgi:predicted RNA-binding Zn-ribbon protein involved in translation (DUF1610 family)